MADYLEAKPAGELLWPGCWPDRAAEMIEHDLAEARAAWIGAAATDKEKAARTKSDFLTYQNKAGEYADFHAQRHTYATVVYRTLPSKMGRDLVRHSTESLADRYTHFQEWDMAGAAASLPPVLQPEEREPPERQVATGTDATVALPGTAIIGPEKPSVDDAPAVISMASGNTRLQNLAKSSPTKGHFGAHRGTQPDAGTAREEKPQTLTGKAESVAGKADGARFERALGEAPEQFSRLPQ